MTNDGASPPMPRAGVALLALAVYATVAIAAWYDMGRPNPMGLGDLSRIVEVAPILAVIAHAASIFRSRELSVEGIS